MPAQHKSQNRESDERLKELRQPDSWKLGADEQQNSNA
jgi:hypothetical protein